MGEAGDRWRGHRDEGELGRDQVSHDPQLGKNFRTVTAGHEITSLDCLVFTFPVCGEESVGIERRVKGRRGEYVPRVCGGTRRWVDVSVRSKRSSTGTYRFSTELEVMTVLADEF